MLWKGGMEGARESFVAYLFSKVALRFSTLVITPPLFLYLILVLNFTEQEPGNQKTLK